MRSIKANGFDDVPVDARLEMRFQDRSDHASLELRRMLKVPPHMVAKDSEHIILSKDLLRRCFQVREDVLPARRNQVPNPV